jgi:hypothetical protein
VSYLKSAPILAVVTAPECGLPSTNWPWLTPCARRTSGGRAGEETVTAAEARQRLLNLFPAQVVRSAWSLGNVTKERAVELLTRTASTQDINAFAFANFPFTKQHVYLFSPSRRLDASAWSNLITDEAPVFRREQDTETQHFYLLDLKFEAVFLDTLERQYIEFKWPILFVVRRELVQVKFTTIERDLRAYFPDAGRVTFSQRSVDEKAILNIVQDELLRSDCKLTALDINRGVKALWTQGYIDSQDARWKKPRSTANETMDERFFLKRDLPELYETLRRAPILKAQFEFMRDQDQFVSHFVVEASNGILRFPLYGTRRESTLNVIAKILELN